MAAPIRAFVGKCRIIGVDVDDGLERWQANLVFRRMVVGRCAAMMDTVENVGAWCGFGVVMIGHPLDLFGTVGSW